MNDDGTYDVDLPGWRSSAARTRAPASTSVPLVRRGPDRVEVGGSDRRRSVATDEGELALGHATSSWRSCRGRATTTRTRSSCPSAWCRTTSSPRSTSRSTRSTPATPSSGPRRSRGTSRTVSEDLLRDLDERGIIRVGAEVDHRRHPGRQGHAQGRDRAHPGRSACSARSSVRRRARSATRASRCPTASPARSSTSATFNREDGDELPPGVNQLVRVYVAQKRKISVGDKLAGRHGNKGVISKILPIEDMPFLADGTPSTSSSTRSVCRRRMNVGQVLEPTWAGWPTQGWDIDGSTQPLAQASGSRHRPDRDRGADNAALEPGGHAGVRRRPLRTSPITGLLDDPRLRRHRDGVRMASAHPTDGKAHAVRRALR